ncbi:hypothetical protein K431DRAFT_289472 [Polychaeton citri CBS 116435]|uniref:Uncharacterized protein n=1 Tax=Polychaeton citri CBS 116435 TaxID=1314669 RepID=A0A9P4PYH7_9PEZI|nr:hypothetical protein K431DRAFT_289472 [Polychaeton citri CBS 116435]
MHGIGATAVMQPPRLDDNPAVSIPVFKRRRSVTDSDSDRTPPLPGNKPGAVPKSKSKRTARRAPKVKMVEAQGKWTGHLPQEILDLIAEVALLPGKKK